SPICPNTLAPQHLTAPALVTAHTWAPPPTETCTPARIPPATTGGVRCSVVAPPTSSPRLLAQQPSAPPPGIGAQLSAPPASTWAAGASSPPTITGWVRRVVVPSPSSPDSLAPQHSTTPVDVSAQVCEKPSATSWMAGAAGLATAAGPPAHSRASATTT